jgi:ELWxxDGT repeat protein
LVKDLNPGPFGSGGVGLTAYGNQLVFAGSDGISGQELWITDGTAAGTIQLADINPGGGNSFPSDMTVKQGQIYFSANDGLNGTELWVSDGTSEGSQLVKDINPGSEFSFPADFLVFNDMVYFIATDGTNGIEIWMTDGTESGTALFADIIPGAEGSNPFDLIQYGGNMYFTALANATDRKLYKSDGSTQGTGIIEPAGTTNSSPVGFSTFGISAVYQGDLYFAAHFTDEGRELWRLSEDVTSTEETDTFDRISVFPNPGSDVFYVDLEESFKQVTIEVLTVLGKVVSRKVYPGGGIIPVRCDEAPGMYVLRIQADAKTFTKKILKQ